MHSISIIFKVGLYDYREQNGIYLIIIFSKHSTQTYLIISVTGILFSVIK